MEELCSCDGPSGFETRESENGETWVYHKGCDMPMPCSYCTGESRGVATVQNKSGRLACKDHKHLAAESD